MNHKSDAEILAELSGAKIEKVRKAIATLGGLRGIFSMNVQGLMTGYGFTKKQAEKILAIQELSKRHMSEQLVGSCFIKEPKTCVDYLYSTIRDLKDEVFKVIYLNKANKVICAEDLFHGTVDETAVHPRKVVEAVIRHGATGVVFAHNHPSGRIQPSREDQEMTRRLQSILSSIGVKVLDHIIIGDNQYFSFNEQNLLN